MALLRRFALQVTSHMTKNTFKQLKYAFPEVEVASFKVTQNRVAFLAAYQPVAYHCCINLCCCYTGPLSSKDACPYCGEACYNSYHRPWKQFTYSPIIPRLKNLVKNPAYVNMMCYRTKHDSNADPGKVDNVFDGSEYH